MIYAKTGMGRMPSNCNQCTFFCAVDDPLKPFGCVIKRKPVNARNGRPSWCPLSAETKEQKIKDIEYLKAKKHTKSVDPFRFTNMEMFTKGY